MVICAGVTGGDGGGGPPCALTTITGPLGVPAIFHRQSVGVFGATSDGFEVLSAILTHRICTQSVGIG